MKLLFLTAAFVLVVSAVPDSEWQEYKAKYKKHYQTEQDEFLRRREYEKTKRMISEHNTEYNDGATSYLMGINEFSDWYHEELNFILGVPRAEFNSKAPPFEVASGVKIPETINWVDEGAVTKVKNQKKCGASFAFSAAGALEALMLRMNNTITELSAQELIDCSTKDEGCEGGWPQNCYGYVNDNDGIHTAESYPYQALKKTCNTSGKTKVRSCNSYDSIGSEEILRAAVGTVGPASIIFSSSKAFFSYKSGIFDGECGDYQNHAMLAVGYGKDEETGKDFWLIKNSWGTEWGQEGYVKVVRNENKCKLGEKASIPVHRSI